MFSVISPIHTAFLDVVIPRQFSASVWMSQRQQGVKLRSGADAPLEVVSEAQCWRNEPVNG